VPLIPSPQGIRALIEGGLKGWERPSSSGFLRLRAEDASATKTLVRQSEEAHRPADDAGRWSRIVIRDHRVRDAGRNDHVDLGGSQRMAGALLRRQIEDGPVDVRHGQSAFLENLTQLFHGRILDLREQSELPREAFEFTDLRAVLLETRLALQRALLDVGAERCQDHSQTGQGAGVSSFLFVKRQL
jgi:hypothetical protein